MEIERTDLTDAVTALLVANDMFIVDLDDPRIELFAMHDGGRLVGVVGLQWLEGAVLLRSLAVAATARERGIGGLLCDAAIREADARGCPDVWLLTTFAKDYFLRRNFVVVPRDQVLDVVRATSQFSSLCPSTAFVMRRV